MSSGNPKTREKILNAAWTLLETAPGPEVRMSDIAKKAGVSRQAIYLHFPTRTDMLVATTLHIDAVKDVDGRLQASRTATTGSDRLDAYIDAWGNYIPEIYGIARALQSMAETDEAAQLAWDGRLAAVRHGCQAVIDALQRDGRLTTAHSADHATDILCVLLSLQTWEQLAKGFGWSQEMYIDKTKVVARQVLVAGPG